MNISTLGKIILSTLVISTPISAQTDDSDFTRYNSKLNALCKKLEDCEKEIGEGNYYYCQLRLLKEFESLEVILIQAVEKGLPPDKVSSFCNVAKLWKRYYSNEKAHRERMKPHHPVVQSIGYLMDLVEMIKARCRILVRQLA